MRIPLYQVDAFASEVFAGNPAAVCPLPGPAWPADALMQRIAAENNLAETAFFIPLSTSASPSTAAATQVGSSQTVDEIAADYHLRWFTPTFEIDLCGHATLASAHVLWTELGCTKETITFASQSGPLVVRRAAVTAAERGEGRKIVLDFPSRPPVPIADRQQWPTDLLSALGIDATTPVAVLESRDLVVELVTAQQVLDLRPDFAALGASPSMKKYVGVIATAPAADLKDTISAAREEGWDFVSRFFAPEVGVPEDPVTGSAHCSLVPLWAAKLGKHELVARQASARGGTLWCTLRGDRVHIAGHAVTYLRGEIDV